MAPHLDQREGLMDMREGLLALQGGLMAAREGLMAPHVDGLTAPCPPFPSGNERCRCPPCRCPPRGAGAFWRASLQLGERESTACYSLAPCFWASVQMRTTCRGLRPSPCSNTGLINRSLIA